jgi:threonine dehydratase
MTVEYVDVLKAQERISGLVHRTPVLTSEKLDAIAGIQLFFKCENLQKVGAFKARGGVNAVCALDDVTAKKGVATHSSGNHGAALARAAALRNIPAYIVIPSNAKQVKQDAIRDYGAEVILCEPTLAAREAKLAEVIERTRAVEIHPYDDASIIAGQGTTALEIIEQVEDLDVIITPVGGGGLLAGCSLVAEQSGLKIYGAEPEGADDAYRSFQSGELVTSHVPDTICDGLLTTVGRQNFEIIKRSVEEILLVSDQETITAMELLWTRLKLVVEPSSAVTLAAVLKYPGRFAGKKVALVLTGGNVDLKDLPFSRS